jgi:hypothetical protein
LAQEQVSYQWVLAESEKESLTPTKNLIPFFTMKHDTTMTKNQLTNALFSKTRAGSSIRIKNIDLVGILSVEREDGSGSSFNVTGYDLSGKKVTVHVRTID